MDSAGHMSGADIIRKKVDTLPDAPGVYRMLDEKGEVLYVGKAANLKKRVSNYTQLPRLTTRLQRMVMLTKDMEFILTRSEAEALLLEANLIKQYQPRYNILLKDDKSFPYIMLDETHDFPRIAKHRGERKKGATYFGPYANAGDVNRAMAAIQKMFLLRPCADTVFSARTRPCMEYQIKRCSAPCVKRIGEKDYAALVQQAKDFLSGKNQDLKEKLQQQMATASAKMQYEKAASLRDRIGALQHVQANQYVNAATVSDADVIGLAADAPRVCVQVLFIRGGQTMGSRAFFPTRTDDMTPPQIMEAFLGRFYQLSPPPPLVLLSHRPENSEVMEAALRLLAERKVSLEVPQRSERAQLVAGAVANAEEAARRKIQEDSKEKELLDGVANLFELEAPPQRIEVYDNSHISGKHAVGGMIVATPEGFNKQAYRRFTVESTSLTGGDDYGMLREVLQRRFSRLKREDPDRASAWPDLVLIDGGAGHLKVATEVLAELGVNDVPYACIAKGADRNAGREVFHVPGKEPFQLPVGDATLYYLQRLRDEAHRYAIFSHRAKRSRAIRSSELDTLTGVGATRKKALLTHFGSVQALRNASVAEIARVPGISVKLAESIHQQLR